MDTVKNKQINLKKKDIAKNISLNIGISSLYSSKIFNDIIKLIISILKSKKKINIKNFGGFSSLDKKQRLGRNPKNKKTHIIEKRTVITFSASNNLKKRINKNA